MGEPVASVHHLPRHAVTARALPPIRHDTSRWGCSSAPGRHENVTCCSIRRDTLPGQSRNPATTRPCAAVRMQIYHVSMLHEIWHVTHLNCPCGGMLGSAGVSKEYISCGWEFLQLQHHDPRASSSYVLAASLQVWNGMMVLLGAAFWTSTECVPPSEAPPPSVHAAVATLEMHDAAISSTQSDVCEPSPSKGVERRGVDSLCGVGSCWQVVVW